MKQLVILFTAVVLSNGADLDSLKVRYNELDLAYTTAKNAVKDDLKNNKEYAELKARMKAIRDSTNTVYGVKKISKQRSALKREVTKLVLGK